MNQYFLKYNGREIKYVVAEHTNELKNVLSEGTKIYYKKDAYPVHSGAFIETLKMSLNDSDYEVLSLPDAMEGLELTTSVFIPRSISEMTDGDLLKEFGVVFCTMDVFNDMNPRFYYSQITSLMRVACMKDAAYYEWLIDHSYDFLDKDLGFLFEAIDECGKYLSFFFEKYPKDEWHKYLDYSNLIEEILKDVVTDSEVEEYEMRALALVTNAHLSYQHNRISLEEYLEIRDMMVPFHQPITIESLSLATLDKYFSNDEGMKIPVMRHLGKLCFNDIITRSEMENAINELYFEETND